MNNEYDVMAKIYDPALYFALKPIRITVMNKLLPYRDKAIIDICCGTGNQLKLLSKNGFNNLSCLDLSSSMLKVAKKNGQQLKIYNEDATKTGFDSEVFDIAIMSFALHEKNRNIQENMINETFRIVKKEGLLLVVDYAFDNNTTKVGRIGISLIERVAGKEHFHNFKNYIQNNGLSSLMEKEMFKLIEEDRKLFNGVTISIYQRL